MYCALEVGCHKETDSVPLVDVPGKLHDECCLFPCDNLRTCKLQYANTSIICASKQIFVFCTAKIPLCISSVMTSYSTFMSS